MDWGALAEGVRPWLSTSALVGLFGLCVKLFLDNRRMTLGREDGIRDHYSKEVAGLRAQVLAVQQSATLTASAAEDRYNKAIAAADQRHAHCEEECERLRNQIRGLERQITQLHRTSIKMFEPKATLPEEVKEQMRSMEQPLIAAMKYSEGDDHESDCP